MTRKLKTYQTSLGFYDLAIAAPSMKAPLEAWGAGSNLFHQGVAKESSDPEVIATTMSKPGVVLRRPVGSDAPFSQRPDLPTHLADDEPRHRPKKPAARPKEGAPPNTDEAASQASIAFENEQRRRENHRREDEAVRKKQRERRDHAIAMAQAALERLRGSTASGWLKSKPSAMLSKGNRKRRTPVGRSRRTNWRRLRGARE